MGGNSENAFLEGFNVLGLCARRSQGEHGLCSRHVKKLGKSSQVRLENKNLILITKRLVLMRSICSAGFEKERTRSQLRSGRWPRSSRIMIMISKFSGLPSEPIGNRCKQTNKQTSNNKDVSEQTFETNL